MVCNDSKINTERAMKANDIIMRILGFIPFAIIILIRFIYLYICTMANYCRYGGETIIYPKDRKSIVEVYTLLEESLRNGKESK